MQIVGGDGKQGKCLAVLASRAAQDLAVDSKSLELRDVLFEEPSRDDRLHVGGGDEAQHAVKGRVARQSPPSTPRPHLTRPSSQPQTPPDTFSATHSNSPLIASKLWSYTSLAPTWVITAVSERRGADDETRTRDLSITNRLHYHCATSA